MMAEFADCVDRLEQECVRADAIAHGQIDPVHARDSVWDGSCVVLQGEGGWFCSGMDLTVLQQDSSASMPSNDFGEYMAILMGDTLNRLKKLPLVSERFLRPTHLKSCLVLMRQFQISVAVVEGGAIGGGAETITSCDHVVVGESARVRFVHATMGLTPVMHCV
jgi:ethylmalonyl-CoA/methylmalonyl-CoA decarboxylase